MMAEHLEHQAAKEIRPNEMMGTPSHPRGIYPRREYGEVLRVGQADEIMCDKHRVRIDMMLDLLHEIPSYLMGANGGWIQRVEQFSP